MTDRIKGITITFRGDTTQLSKALTTVRKEANSTRKELKAIDYALKFNPNNITLLTQKQQLLKQRVSETADRIKVLKAEQQRMANDPSVDKKSAEYRKLEREIVKAESQQRQFAREMVKFGGSARLTQLSNGLTTVGKKLTGVTRNARLAAGAIAGMALFKGFERLKTLDEVSTSLEKLGYKGEHLESIMEDAKGSVSGTRFALTDMAKVAQGALGSGVEDKYKLGDYLGRVGDLAQVAGIDVQSMGAMMNKALSKGTVDAKLLNQMNANGIPIYTLLAQHLGVTTDELQKMVRTGKVGFDDLYQATEKYNGLAQEMGTNTFSGAVTVLGQQFGLIGASFLEGAYEPMKEGVQGIVQKLKELQENGTIKEWGNAAGEAIRYFVEWFRTGEAEIDNMTPKAQGLVTAFSPVVKTIGSLVKFFIGLPAPVKGAVAAFALFGGPLLTVAGGLLKIVNMGVGLMKLVKIVGSLSSAFTLLTGFNPIALAIVAGIAAVIAIGVALYKNWDKIKSGAITVKDAVVGAFQRMRDTLRGVFEAIFKIVTAPFRKAWEIIKGVIEKIKGAFKFKISLPKIKLPHFSIKPKGWKFGDLLKGDIPSLGIDWYAKGGIFTRPTIIGNKGFGEAGAEAALPLSALWKEMDGMFMRMADSIVNGVSMSMALQNAGMGGEIHIDNYLYPNGPKMGEETVRMYDQYKKILG